MAFSDAFLRRHQELNTVKDRNYYGKSESYHEKLEKNDEKFEPLVTDFLRMSTSDVVNSPDDYFFSFYDQLDKNLVPVETGAKIINKIHEVKEKESYFPGELIGLEQKTFRNLTKNVDEFGISPSEFDLLKNPTYKAEFDKGVAPLNGKGANSFAELAVKKLKETKKRD